MDHLQCPTNEKWLLRQSWFESTEESYRADGSYVLSEQVCALIAEVQSVFCVGAWISVIILSVAVIDAQLREIDFPDFKGSTKQLFNSANLGDNVQQLRKRRNELIHVNVDHPSITVDQQWSNRRILEDEAKEAVTIMFSVFYETPCI